IPRPDSPDRRPAQRIQLHVGNRDLFGFDFKWIDEDQIVKREAPADVFFVERREYGPLIGTPVLLKDGEREIARGGAAVWLALPELLDKAARDRQALRRIEKDEIGSINYEIERARLEARKRPERKAELDE